MNTEHESGDRGHGRVECWKYRCASCGHEVHIYERAEQSIFCRCEEEGPPMKPVERVIK